MRLINADALKELIAANVYPVFDDFNSRDYGMFWTGGIEKAIDEATTVVEIKYPITRVMVRGVEYIPVVRCKDCRYWAYDCEGDFGIKYGRCSRWADAWGEHEPETTDRDYCSYADRKTEQTERSDT